MQLGRSRDGRSREKQEGGQETQFSVSRTERGSRQHRAGPLAGGQPMDVVGI